MYVLFIVFLVPLCLELIHSFEQHRSPVVCSPVADCTFIENDVFYDELEKKFMDVKVMLYSLFIVRSILLELGICHGPQCNDTPYMVSIIGYTIM